MNVAASESLDADDWLFNSVKLYDDLHMYEIQHASRSVAWIDEDKLAVATAVQSGGSELLQLSLPSALLQKNLQDGRQKTDFKVLSGGLTHSDIISIKHIPQTRLLVATNSHINALSLWNIPEDETVAGLMTEKCLINSHMQRNFPSCMDVYNSQIGFASHCDNISVVDIVSESATFTGFEGSDQILSCLHFVTDCILLGCEKYSGKLHIVDIRAPQCNVTSSEDRAVVGGGVTWTCDVKRLVEAEQTLALKLCSNGTVSVCDVRCLNKEVSSLSLNQDTTDPLCSQLINVKIGNEELFSVSGFDDKVYIYSLTQLSLSSVLSMHPVFVHSGHSCCVRDASRAGTRNFVNVHSWHPRLEKTVLSCARDGSLHAWTFNIDEYQRMGDANRFSAGGGSGHGRNS